MTHFGLPDDALALRDGLREVLTTACSTAVVRAAWDGDPCEPLWKSLGSFGLPGLLAAEAVGGLGLDELSFVAALEEAGWHGVPGPLVETMSYLPALDLPVDGSARLAVQRPAAVNVAYAQVATHVIRPYEVVAARGAGVVQTVDRSRAMGALAPAPTMTIVAKERYDDFARASLRATLGTAAFLLGLARRQVDLTVAYVKERQQFGVAVGSFQAVKHPLADAVVGTEFAWPAVMRAAYSLATGDPAGSLHVSMAKALASDASYRVSRVCLQAHGAMGYTVEYDLHLFAKRTWALANEWGTAREHRAAIARTILERNER
ncbi:MAG: acyl-CoA dehydrogenase domain protein [Frankiales bacterium]|nr:acyl-CoA dehydrogenase domain protein [Frankiales bacterium]